MLGHNGSSAVPQPVSEPGADPSNTRFPAGPAASWRSLLLKRREPGSRSDCRASARIRLISTRPGVASPPSCAHPQSRRSVLSTWVPRQRCLGVPVMDLIPNGEKCPQKVLLSTPMLGPFRHHLRAGEEPPGTQVCLFIYLFIV